MKPDRKRINKILVIKQSAIGDVLLSTPVIENLRHNFPSAQIDFMTQLFCRDVVSGNPYVSNILTYDIKTDKSKCILKNIRKKKYDLVIDLFGNPRTAIMTFYSGARYKVGYRFSWRKMAYNIKVEPRSSKVHNIEFNLDALRALDLEIISSKPFLHIDNINQYYADKFFKEAGLNSKPVIAFNPGGTWETKVWYEKNFTELINKFTDKYNVILIWGNEKEKVLAESIKSNIADNVFIIPKTDLKTLGAILKKCKLFVTNDTGPMHIAWVLGVNTAAIFGPTNSELQGPVSENSIIMLNKELDCLGCNLTTLVDCPYGHRCMKDLTQEQVYLKLKEFMIKIDK